MGGTLLQQGQFIHFFYMTSEYMRDKKEYNVWIEQCDKTMYKIEKNKKN